MSAKYKNTLSAVIVLICAVAGLGQAPPEIKAKLDVEIKALTQLSTDAEIVNASRPTMLPRPVQKLWP